MATKRKGKTEKKGYTVREVAEMLGFHKQSIYKFIYKGEIPAVRIGRRILIPAWYIEELFSKEASQDKRGRKRKRRDNRKKNLF